MELEVLNNLNNAKENKEYVDISFCNEFGEVGLVKKVLITEVDKRKNAITVKVPCKNDKSMEVNFVLDNSSKNKMNSFYALMIKNSKVQKDVEQKLFVNLKPEELLYSTKKYSFHMGQTYIKDWRKDEAIDFLLCNVGKYITIAEGTHRYNGILKSVSFDRENNMSLVTLIKSPNVLVAHRLNNKCKIISHIDKEYLEYENKNEFTLELDK